MPHWRRLYSDDIRCLILHRRILERCLRTKSGHGYTAVDRRAGKHGEDKKEGKMQLFKSRGQHLLTNPRVLDTIVRVSDIKSDDTILEIGPGTGNLTLKLLEAAKNVVAVEIDKRMVDALQKRVAGSGFLDRLNIINGDALKTEFPQFNLVVANIPFNISSPLLAKLVYGVHKNPFRSATLLLQKEFARRLLATPGDSEFNRLAVNMNLVAEIEFVMDVSKRDFVPCPRVDSSVIKLHPKTQLPDVNLEEWWAFTRTCFCKKNKTLGATLKKKRKLMELLKLSKSNLFLEDENDQNLDGDDDCAIDEGTSLSLFKGKIVNVLESGGFSDKRPSKLSQDDLLQLLSLFNEAGVYFHDHSKTKDVYDSECSDSLL